MRLNRVDERRNNRSGNLISIALVAGVIVVLLIVVFLIFGGNSEESGSQTTMESDNVEILDPTVVPTLMPTSQPIAKLVPTALPTTAKLVPTALPTTVPTAVPTAVPTVVPTVVPITIPTPVPTVEVVKLPLPSIVNDNPPHVFVGTVTISGQPAPKGTEVTAWVLNYSEPAGSSIVPAVSGEPGSYSLLVPQYGTNFNGTVLVLKVNDTFVTNAVWVSGEAELLDLTP